MSLLAVSLFPTEANKHAWITDVLDTFDEVRIAISYSLDGKQLESFPANLDVLNNITVEYKTFSGWQESTKGLKSYNDLPIKARDYIEFIEKYVGVRIRYIGVGPARDDMIIRC